MRKTASLLCVCAASLFAPQPAGAIINGHTDSQHPYVGMVFNQQVSCSGTLIAPSVFLTASHCTDALIAPGATPAWVTFRQNGTSFPEDIPVRAAYTEPRWCDDDAITAPPCPGTGLLGYDQNDVGIVILAMPVHMTTYGALPAPGLVDSLPQKTGIVQVGYGLQVRSKVFTDQAYQRLSGVAQLYGPGGEDWAPMYYRVTVDPGAGKDAMCFGDSGGPDFLPGSNIILGVHAVVKNLNCAGQTFTTRVDRTEIIAWILSFE